MAQAVVTVAIKAFPQGIDITQRNAHLYGSLTIGPVGSTYVTNGLPVDFNAVAYDLRLPIFAGKKAFHVDMFSPSSGFVYEYDPVNFTIHIFQGGAAVSLPLAEIANAAVLPAGVTSDTVYFHAVFQRG